MYAVILGVAVVLLFGSIAVACKQESAVAQITAAQPIPDTDLLTIGKCQSLMVEMDSAYAKFPVSKYQIPA